MASFASARSSREREVELLEARDLLLRERLVTELRQRLAAPEGECLVEQRRPPHRLARARSIDEASDARQVELVGPSRMT